MASRRAGRPRVGDEHRLRGPGASRDRTRATRRPCRDVRPRRGRTRRRRTTARSVTCVRSTSPPTRTSWPPIRAVRQSSAPPAMVRVRPPCCTRPSEPVIAPVTSSWRAGDVARRPRRARAVQDLDRRRQPHRAAQRALPRSARRDGVRVRPFSRPGAASPRRAKGTSLVVARRSTKPTTFARAPARSPDDPAVRARRPGDAAGCRRASRRHARRRGRSRDAE